MSTVTLLALVLQSNTDGGLTLHDVIASLPTDPVSLFVVGLVIASALLVLWTGRPGGGRGGRPA